MRRSGLKVNEWLIIQIINMGEEWPGMVMHVSQHMEARNIIGQSELEANLSSTNTVSKKQENK